MIPAVALSILIGIGIGIGCELIAVRPLRIRGGGFQQNELVTTIGVSTIIIGLLGVKWGYEPLLVPFRGPTTPVHFLGIIAAPVSIILVGGAVVFAFALHFWFHYTRWGRACLAVAEDRPAATLRGINVNLFSLGGFGAAGRNRDALWIRDRSDYVCDSDFGGYPRSRRLRRDCPRRAG